MSPAERNAVSEWVLRECAEVFAMAPTETYTGAEVATILRATAQTNPSAGAAS